MRDGRQRAQLVAGAVGAAGLIVMWGSAVALSASPDPSAPVGSPTALPTPAPSASPTPAPTDPPSPSQAPQPTPTASPRAFDCEESFARVDGNEHIVRGEMVRVGYEGYAPGSEVTLVFVDFSDMVERPIGQGTAARDGTGRIAGVVPPDSTIGQAELQIVSGECWSHVYFVVIGSPETMRVDDPTVVPGQRVTVTARGFQPDSPPSSLSTPTRPRVSAGRIRAASSAHLQSHPKTARS